VSDWELDKIIVKDIQGAILALSAITTPVAGKTQLLRMCLVA